MTLSEVIALRSTLVAAGNPRFQCESCLEKESDAARVVKGCEVNSSARVVSFKHLHLRRCPANFATQGMINWVESHTLFRQGVMPFPGALMDQPNKVIELFRVVEDFRAEKAAAEAQRARLKKGMQRGR